MTDTRADVADAASGAAGPGEGDGATPSDADREGTAPAGGTAGAPAPSRNAAPAAGRAAARPADRTAPSGADREGAAPPAADQATARAADHPAPAPAVDRAAAAVVHPGDLPGVRARLRAVAADLADGLNCLWLVPDALVESGLADELYRGALFTGPVRIDVPAPDRAPTRAREPEPDPGPHGEGGWGWDDADELPYLDLPDDGFDLDLGWSLEARPPRVPAPRQEPGGGRHDPHGLLTRLGGELAVDADEAVAALVAPGRDRRPVVGIRAWTEHDGGTDTSRGTAASTGTGTSPGAAVERLFRALAAAVKAAGLPPGERPGSWSSPGSAICRRRFRTSSGTVSATRPCTGGGARSAGSTRPPRSPRSWITSPP
ncbi:hypothetical protein ACWGN5_41015 [Streptomyces sp. NPDC055815]